jgi:hypothetical protein
MDDTTLVPEQLAGGPLAAALGVRCGAFVHPLLVQLDEHLDCRLVRTLAQSIVALVAHRNRPAALLLSELGAYLAGPEHAPAGTKRLANLLHSPRWQAAEIAASLLEQGRARSRRRLRRCPRGGRCVFSTAVCSRTPRVGRPPGSPRSARARRGGCGGPAPNRGRATIRVPRARPRSCRAGGGWRRW